MTLKVTHFCSVMKCLKSWQDVRQGLLVCSCMLVCVCSSECVGNIADGTEPTAPVPFSVPAPQGARYVKKQRLQ